MTRPLSLTPYRKNFFSPARAPSLPLSLFLSFCALLYREGTPFRSSRCEKSMALATTWSRAETDWMKTSNPGLRKEKQVALLFPRWASTTALPKQATKRFIYVVRGGPVLTDSLPRLVRHVFFAGPVPLSHTLCRASRDLSLSLFHSCRLSRESRKVLCTNDLISGLLQQVLLCAISRQGRPILYISCLLSDVRYRDPILALSHK